MARRRYRYGAHRAQVADLHRPASPAALPVVVLIHGGFWRPMYTRVLMRRLAEAVVAEGWAAWNIEYRRPGRFGGGGGWPATFADVAAAVDHVAELDGVDPARVVACGHSAGGHLALWAAARGRLARGTPGADVAVALRGAVALAGIPDLAEADRLGVGGDAVRRLMGGGPDDHPDRFRLGSPAALIPIGVPLVLLHGTADATVPPALSEHFVGAAGAAGDAAVWVPVPEAGHRDIIDPGGPGWGLAVAHLRRLLGS